MLKNGINFFDTAPSYGNGKVENIIGQFIKEKKLNDLNYNFNKRRALYNKKILKRDKILNQIS